ncbi:hypothetical protein AB0F81_46350 [Actinoplanes sp. NPDC024001]|uniref:hypothetical protein n=1 Tax=Actinoplanes sp. NPDC024001 TaxID=3154598 RepID=UPI0033F2EFA0
MTYVIGVVPGVAGARPPGRTSALAEGAAVTARKIIETLPMTNRLLKQAAPEWVAPERADAAVPGLPLPAAESGRGENTVMRELRAIQHRASV